jgi:hypothetical protein
MKDAKNIAINTKTTKLANKRISQTVALADVRT